MGLKVSGLDRFRRRVADYANRVARAAARALREEAEEVMAASKRVVPVDTGVLRSTGMAETVRADADGAAVRLSYGGPAAPYALVQHEDLTLQHSPGQEAKYLERPLLERRKGLERRLAARVRTLVRG